jgi:hypothetical protein
LSVLDEDGKPRKVYFDIGRMMNEMQRLFEKK